MILPILHLVVGFDVSKAGSGNLEMSYNKLTSALYLLLATLALTGNFRYLIARCSRRRHPKLFFLRTLAYVLTCMISECAR